ncbi:hypothetical protein [Ruminococcus sp.]|uniref:hypothetical protein n=1 Tax=Ruminococcus sp. TaxID=41978 RepID=UPI0025EBE13C|nr:hypothetical protein [Ruminococcus sp.]
MKKCRWDGRCKYVVSWILCEDIASEEYSEGEKDESIVRCDGFQIEIFSDRSEKVPVDVITAAVGVEILSNSVQDAEQFAKDVIDSEEKEYLRLLEEYAEDD